MKIDQAVSSCKAIFDYAFGSQLIQFILLGIFVVYPLLKVLATIVKTKKKYLHLISQPSLVIPLSLRKIIKKHTLSEKLFYISPNREFIAVSAGFFSRKILLSQAVFEIFSYEEIEAIVLHELHHTNFFHSIITVFSEFCASFLFFLPISYDIHLQVKSELEKSADKFAIERQRTAKHIRSSLKKALMIESSLTLFPQFSYRVIEQRIDSLNEKKTWLIFSPRNFFVSLVILFVYVSLFLLNNRYAMAAVVEEKITCSVFDCVKDCVVYEFTKEPLMSEINYSVGN